MGCEACDANEICHVDLRYLVAGLMIVFVFAGEVEDHGDAFHCKGCLIAAEEVLLDVVGKVEGFGE